MFLINGERRHCIDVADRGFQYGDGLFETLEVLNGKPLFLERHLRRLANGCRRLLIPVPDKSVLADEAMQVSASAEHAVLKIIVTRGMGGRGYRQPPQISPTRVLSLHPYPVYPESFQSDGINLRFCTQRLALNPTLAGIKHLNRLEQILARAEWQDEEIQEGLMLNGNDQIIEGTMSNLFVVKDGVLHTPSLGECGIAGIVREIVIELAARNEIPWQETTVDKDAVLAADELFVSNSVIGIWPVKQLEQYRFSVGPLTQTLQKLFNARRMTEELV